MGERRAVFIEKKITDKSEVSLGFMDIFVKNGIFIQYPENPQCGYSSQT